MVSVTASDLSRYRATENSLMADSATNSRTAVTTGCRVSDGRAHTRLGGLPSYLAPRMKLIIMPDAQDVREGDVYTVTGHAAGTYTAIHDLNPGTYSTSTRILCLAQGAEPGSKLPVAANATVTFINPQRPDLPPVTADVYLYPTGGDDIRQFGLEPGLLNAVAFDPTLADSAGNLVTTGWQMRAAMLGRKADGSQRKATLKVVRRTFGTLAVATGFFETPA